MGMANGEPHEPSVNGDTKMNGSASPKMAAQNEPLAIVGMAFKFPQEASSEVGLWDMLMSKRNAMTEFPPDRANIASFYHQDLDRPDTLNFKGGHFLKEIPSAFDAPFFSVSVAEANAMDPQQRLALEVTYHALEKAGLSLEEINGSNTSVHAGCFSDDYKRITLRDPDHFPRTAASSVSHCMLSNRISWFFNLHGASATVDTACSSSMTAFDMSCQGLWNGDSDTAITVGSNLMLGLETALVLSNMSFLSPDSTCFSFDHRANGYGRGEGVGALVVKRLSSAIQSGDPIRAIIRATKSNQDGRTPGITQPSGAAQEKLIRATYAKFGLDMGLTSYVEAHGTGTRLGDPIEATAIASAFKSHRKPDTPLHIGSIKSNLGHLEGCSGIAGIIKTALMLEKGVLVPNANFEKLNPSIDAAKLNIQIVTEPMPWPTEGLRRASISSFGFGGANVHVVMDDAYHTLKLLGLEGNHFTNPGTSGKVNGILPPTPHTNGTGPQSHTSTEPSSQRLLVLSSADQQGIQRVASSLQSHATGPDRSALSAKNGRYLDDLLHTVSNRRTRHKWRSFALVNSLQDMADLGSNLSKPTKCIDLAKLAFCFTGQGAQYAGMAQGLLCYPIFADSLERSEGVFKRIGCPWDLSVEMFKSADKTRINEAGLSQPLCTALQIALVDLLRHFGVAPSVVFGHSSGEIAAAYATGVISHSSGCKIAYYRGLCADELLHKTRSIGHSSGMMAVALSSVDFDPYIDRLNEKFESTEVVVACINGPRNITVSGRMEQIDWLKGILDEEEILCRKLRVEIAYHSPEMRRIAQRYSELLADLEDAPQTSSSIPMVSSVTGELVAVDELQTPDYWVRNMLQPVRFSDAISAALELCDASSPTTMSAQGKRLFHDIVEIGPHSTLRAPILDTLRPCSSTEVGYVSVLDRSTDAQTSLLKLAGNLYCKGHSINITRVNNKSEKEEKSRVALPDLPSYPFDHSRHYWQEIRSSKDGYRLRKHPRLDLLGTSSPNWNPLEPRWSCVLRVSEQTWIKDHTIKRNVIYPAAGMISMALEAVKQLVPDGSQISGYAVKEAAFVRPIMIPADTEEKEVEIVLRPYQISSQKRETAWKFLIYAVEADGRWQEKCQGVVSAQYTQSVDPVDNGQEGFASQSRTESMIDEMERTCTEVVDSGAFYEVLKAKGFHYGNSFQAVSALKSDHSDSICAVVDVFGSLSLEKGISLQDHLIHPTTLDAIMHTSFAADSHGLQRDFRVTLPTRVTNLWIRPDGVNFRSLKNARIYVKTQSTKHSATAEVFATELVTRKTILSMKLESSLIEQDDNNEDGDASPGAVSYGVQWKPDLDLMDNSALSEYCRPLHPSQTNEEDFFENMDFVMMKTLADLLEKVSRSSVAKMPEPLQKYIEWATDCYQRFRSGKIAHCKSSSPVWQKISTDAVYHDAVFSRMEKSKLGRFYTKIAAGLPAILNGEIDAVQFMFQDDKVEDFYNTINFQILNWDRFGRYLDLLTHKNPSLKVMEIGAGTGSVTHQVIEALKDQDGGPTKFSSFDYTDISPTFLSAGAERYAEHKAKMNYRILDVDKDPIEQGFEAGSYDVVVCGSVLHATRNLERTLQRIRNLLKPGGKLILIEIVAETVRMSSAFGLFPGWWLGEEESRHLQPWISTSEWSTLMHRTGFSGVDIEIRDHEIEAYHEFSMIITTAVDEQVPQHGDAPIMLITNDDSVVQKGVASALTTSLKKLEFPAEITNWQQVSKIASTERRQWISLCELDQPLVSALQGKDFDTLKRLTLSSQGILWVRGEGNDQDTRSQLDTVTGLARTICTENQRIAFTTLRLQAASDPASVASRILQVLQGHLRDPSGREHEYLERGEHLCISRLARSAVEEKQINGRMSVVRSTQQAFDKCPPLALRVGRLGLLDTIHLAEDHMHYEGLSTGMVEIKVEASGVNFRDCLTALGQVEADYIGIECAGIVSRVSKDCKFKVGDRVAGFCKGSYQTYVRIPASLLVPVPDSVPFTEAAASMVIFCTAWHSLLNVGHLQKGESVLIHSAAGGTGQASIQVAQYLGAEVYATVGSQEKKGFLQKTYGIPDDHIFASRNLTFKEGVMRVTKGKGVDVILNSLSGESLLASWECIAKFGRFVEIGVRDIAERSQLPMWQFRQAATFSAVALDMLIEERPEFVMGVADRVLRLLGEKTFSIPQPLTVFGLSEVEKAFRVLQTGSHYGKMIVQMRPNEIVEARFKPRATYGFDPNRTYVVTGGTGGIGRSVVRWMVNKGARNFILLSRSGSKSKSAQDLIKELSAREVLVEVPSCDIGERSAVERVLAESKLPPVAGCIQSAMVLKDRFWENMTFDDWTTACKPKIEGTWNLHTLLPSGLDFFVCLSSLACIVGATGQANYAAGNTFMDELVRYRIAQGQRGTTINLGWVAEEGIIADSAELQASFSKIESMPPVSMVELYALLDYACDPSRPPEVHQLITGLAPPYKTIVDPMSLEAREPWLFKPVFRSVLHAAADANLKEDKGTKTTGPDYFEMFRQASTNEEATQVVAACVRARLSTALAVPENELDMNSPLSDIGVDSLFGIELKNYLARRFGADIAVFELLGTPSVMAACAMVVERSTLRLGDEK